MPLYDYQCKACATVTEVRHGFREVHDGACPNCGGALTRVFNPAGIVFKGSGFYITDSRTGSGSGEGGSKSDSSSSSSSSSTSSSSSSPSSSSSSSSGSTNAA